MLILPGTGKAVVSVKANYIHSQTSGTAYGITIRNNCDVVMNILEYYEAYHSNFDIRNHSGKIVINCPKISMITGNYYGGSYKQVIIIRDSAGGTMEVNGNLVNEDTAGYLGGSSGMISRTGNSYETLRINGNIYEIGRAHV